MAPQSHSQCTSQNSSSYYNDVGVMMNSSAVLGSVRGLEVLTGDMAVGEGCGHRGGGREIQRLGAEGMIDESNGGVLRIFGSQSLEERV